MSHIKMDPIAPQSSSIPPAVWQMAGWVVAGAFTVLTTLLGFLGKRHIEIRDKHIDEIRDRQQSLSEQIDTLQTELKNDHGGVESKLDEILDHCTDHS